MFGRPDGKSGHLPAAQVPRVISTDDSRRLALVGKGVVSAAGQRIRESECFLRRGRTGGCLGHRLVGVHKERLTYHLTIKERR